MRLALEGRHLALQNRLPPLEQRALANEFEPRRESQRVVFEHILQLILGHVLRRLDFIWVLVDIDVGLDEEDVIN